jgi:antitoxin (DNA-binding transcriptional repressor) of toxin-antitoxin stability system
MITVGVRDLKNQLSRYLQFVKNGENVIITEHSRIIAEIILPQTEKKSTIWDEFQRMSEDGDLIPAKRQVSCVPLPETKEKVDWWSEYEATREDRV